MTDKELLELAAKAAGHDLPKPNPWLTYSDHYGFQWMNMDGSAVTKSFNPLNDDGDALRLAVKCNLNVCVGYASVSACLQDDGSFLRTEEIKDDPYAATRRAIVRAAAEIGKRMR